MALLQVIAHHIAHVGSKLASDGHGGTVVYDPPVSAATDQNPLALLHTQH